MKSDRTIACIALTLGIVELLLALVSWLLGATTDSNTIRSMLSSEGIRWMFGHFAEMLSSRYLVWLVLLSIASGPLWDCGIFRVFHLKRSLLYRERTALFLVGGLLLIIIASMLLLTAVPHAVLLSVTGDLYPSPFSESIVPVASFSIALLSVVYGGITSVFSSLTDVYHSLVRGVSRCAPLFLFYILIFQLIYSVRFIFSV